MLRALILFVTIWLTGLTAQAQTNALVITPPVDVALAVLKGIDFFRAQAATNDEAWLFHPIPGQRVSGYTNRTERFKEVEYTIPGRKFEEYEVLVPGTSSGEPLRTEKRYRVVGLDPSKDRKETRLTSDPNGPIVREFQSAIYEKDQGCRWRYGSLGNNGMAILALRRCGIKADDPLVYTPASNLAGILLTYGLPDNLHDLAWLTAGFAVMPGDGFKKLTEECAAKLLDAQITTGPAAGLWGPAAVNTPMVAALLKTFSRLGEAKQALQAELVLAQSKKSKTKVQQIESDIERIDNRVTALQDDARRVTQLGLRLFDSLGPAYQLGRLYLQNHEGQYLGIEGLPYLIHNQIGADLDSTAKAIFALRVAFENGRLPLKTWRPDPPKPANPGAPSPVQEFPPGRATREVLTLAAQAITAARTAAGQWPELNIHQTVSDFTWLKSMSQVKPELIPKLAQPVTLASTVRGAATLANIQMMQTGAAKPTALENPACRALVPDLLAGKPLANSNDVIRTPYQVLLQTTALRTNRGKSLRTDFTTWNDVAEWVIGKQAESGAWGRVNKMVFMPSTSLVALREALGEMQSQDLEKNYDKPHLCTGFLAPGWQIKYTYTEPEQSYFTAAALLFLADGLPDNWTPTGTP